MRHGHPPGWAPAEIGRFIDIYCRAGPPLPEPGPLAITDEAVELVVTPASAVVSATLHYTTDTGLRSKRGWQSRPATIRAGRATAPRPPADANTWFIAITDAQGGMTTTAIQFHR